MIVIVGKKKGNGQDDNPRVPARRAHSKNEKYPLEEGGLLDHDDSIDMPPHYSTHNG